MGKIFYLMGKSATGKDTMFQHLVDSPEFDLKTVVLYTTRPIREGEVEGVEYHFIDEAEMERYLESGKVIEKRTYHTVCGDWSYMTIDDGQFDLEKYNYVAIGTLESYAKIREYFGPEAMVPIYIWVEDGDRLARALKREPSRRSRGSPRCAAAIWQMRRISRRRTWLRPASICGLRTTTARQRWRRSRIISANKYKWGKRFGKYSVGTVSATGTCGAGSGS